MIEKRVDAFFRFDVEKSNYARIGSGQKMSFRIGSGQKMSFRIRIGRDLSFRAEKRRRGHSVCVAAERSDVRFGRHVVDEEGRSVWKEGK